MTVIILLLLGAGVFGTVKAFKDDNVGMFFAFLTIGLVGLLLSALLVRWQPANQTLTGYVYQRQDRWGYSKYSLRFSQNAGMDEQPSFCVKSGSEEDKKIAKFVGADTKVEIFVPSSGLRIASNFFECSSYAQFNKFIEEK